MGRYYKEYADFLAMHFPGRKMQKLTVDAGFSCPNRDGTLSTGGCAYCNNNSFSPGSHEGRTRLSVARQIEESKIFFRRKYPAMRYLAYFQSYTNTHGELSRLLGLYDEALAEEGVDGLIIGTRPDCLPQPLIDALAMRHRSGQWIMVELGAESSHDITLNRVNRCHTWQTTVDAVNRLRQAGLPVGLHLIMGLPGETCEMMMETVRRAALLHPDTIKFHRLHANSRLLHHNTRENHPLQNKGNYPEDQNFRSFLMYRSLCSCDNQSENSLMKSGNAETSTGSFSAKRQSNR